MTLGSRICIARETAGLTAQQLSQSVGVLRKTLRNWEADRSEPRANQMVTLAGVLGVSINWLSLGDGALAERDQPMTAFEETLPLKQKLGQIMDQHEKMSALMHELQQDVERLQAKIDNWDLSPEEPKFEDPEAIDEVKACA